MKELWYTVGPASLGKETDLFLNGATGIRLTFNFGTSELQHERAINIKKEAAQVGHSCYVVADLGGEKFRLGTFQGESSLFVKAGTIVRLIFANTTSPSVDGLILPVPNPSFFSQLKKGSIVIVGDGAAVLVVTSISSNDVLAEIASDGVINHCRGLTIQGGDFRPRSLTSKDLLDLEHILSSSIYDAVALSFLGSEADILQVRQLAKMFKRDISIVAKIETVAGIENIDSICRSADFVMAARGDLALAMPWVELPAAVRHIASSAKANSTPWILATQIVEGLERFVIPTRAEICDMAHWLEEGCAGVLLSYETAFGVRPVAAVACAAALLARWGNGGSAKS